MNPTYTIAQWTKYSAVFLSLSIPASLQAFATEAQPPKLVSEFVKAKPIERKAPRYPKRAAQRGQEGWVQISMVIDEKGNVTDAVILDSSGVRSLERSALSAVKRWSYEPALENGKPVQQCDSTVQMDFRLDNNRRSITRKFRQRYLAFMDAVEQQDVAKAEEWLVKIKEKEIWNRYEDFLYWYGMARLSELRQQPEEQLKYARRALNVVDIEKDLNSYIELLETKYVLLVNQGHYAESEGVIEELRALIDESEVAKRVYRHLLPTAEKVSAALVSDRMIARSGDLGERGVWSVDLNRQQFMFSKVQGEVSTLDVRCENKRMKYEFKTGFTWRIPSHWRNCSVLVRGEESANLTLLELPDNQI